MKPTPKGWPRISSSVSYDDARAAIRWLCEAFGFEVRILVDGEGGKVAHAELLFGDGLIMVGDVRVDRDWRASPRSLGGKNTQTLFVYVDDIEAHCARARSAGAQIVSEPKDVDYGEDHWADRGYECVDVGGHHWYFAQRVRG